MSFIESILKEMNENAIDGGIDGGKHFKFGVHDFDTETNNKSLDETSISTRWKTNEDGNAAMVDDDAKWPGQHLQFCRDTCIEWPPVKSSLALLYFFKYPSNCWKDFGYRARG